MLYTPRILDHCANPRNFGTLDPHDASHEEENSLCGDRIRIDLRVAGDKIAAIRFSGVGCAVSLAAASILSELIDGRDVAYVFALSADELVAELAIPLTNSRLACAVLGLTVVKVAIANHSNLLVHSG
jgi:nitrogen fixation NifU-like protein